MPAKPASWYFQRSRNAFITVSSGSGNSFDGMPIDGETQWHVEAWVKLFSSDGRLLSERFTGAGNPISLVCGFSDGVNVENNGLFPAFGWYNGSTWITAAASNQAVTLGSWTHVLFVHEPYAGPAPSIFSNTCTIWINGRNVTKTSSPTPAVKWLGTNTNQEWFIGRRWDLSAGGTYLNGLVHNFSVRLGNPDYLTDPAGFTPPSTLKFGGFYSHTCNKQIYENILVYNSWIGGGESDLFLNKNNWPLYNFYTGTNIVALSETPSRMLPGTVADNYNDFADILAQEYWPSALLYHDYSASHEVPVEISPQYPNLPPPSVRALIVAGGGGGGHSAGGGGGGGGVIYTPAVVVSSNTVYSIIVGTGGSGGWVSGALNATNGTNSSFAGLEAIGGGGGGSSNAAGGSGGSGGGGGNRTGQQGGSGTSDQGFAGGSSLAGDVSGTGSGGGGGGASAAGTTPTTTIKGIGGDGIISNITGQPRAFGGGGGGGMRWLSGIGAATGDTVTGAPGGLGGGGTGGSGSNSGTGADTAGTAGSTNTGGGGGGGGHDANSQKDGGGGGSGIVIIKYANTYTEASVTGNPVSYVLKDQGVRWRIYEFTATGSITFL